APATGDGAAAQQAEGRVSDGRFVASSRGQVYYWKGCDNWKRLNQANLRWFDSPEEAENAGYRPSQARGCAPQSDTALIAAARSSQETTADRTYLQPNLERIAQRAVRGPARARPADFIDDATDLLHPKGTG